MSSLGSKAEDPAWRKRTSFTAKPSCAPPPFVQNSMRETCSGASKSASKIASVATGQTAAELSETTPSVSAASAAASGAAPLRTKETVAPESRRRRLPAPGRPIVPLHVSPVHAARGAATGARSAWISPTPVQELSIAGKGIRTATAFVRSGPPARETATKYDPCEKLSPRPRRTSSKETVFHCGSPSSRQSNDEKANPSRPPSLQKV